MNEISIIEKLAERYEKNPYVRTLVPLIFTPIAQGVDAFLITKLQQIRKDRARDFFDELARGKIELTEEIIKSEDFLHCFFATTKAALNTRRREKIEMFARLLKNVVNEKILDVDEYEDLLKILDELSYHEIIILMILEKYENINYLNKEPRDSIYKTVFSYWDAFIAEISEELKIHRNEIESKLVRLTRSGCYDMIIGYDRRLGKLTPLYFLFKEYISK